MTRPLVVYFDTNFFVWLAKADEALAAEIISGLNALQVRHVLSDMIIRELLSSSNRANHDKVLFERVQRFKLSPYRTSDNLAWECLLLSGETRKFVADTLKLLSDDLTTEASSHSIMARRISEGRVSADQMAELDKSMQPFLDEHGLSLNLGDKEKNLEAASAFAAKMIATLKDALPENSALRELEQSDNPLEDLTMLMNLFDAKEIQAVEELNHLQESVTRSEERPYQVAAGIADSNAKRNLGHTLRDAEHMKTFVLHRNEIDLFQIDRAQMNIVNNSNSIHRLVELGLAERCFTVSSLSEVPQVVRKMKSN